MKDKVLGFLRAIWSKVQPILEKVKPVLEKVKPVWEKVKYVICSIGSFLPVIWKWILRFKKIILAIPVVIGAIYMAVFTANRLPDYVGIDLQATGEYSRLVTRDIAVLGPLAVTALCLLLMFCSKRTLYPWLISLFSLALPLLILITNVFPV